MIAHGELSLDLFQILAGHPAAADENHMLEVISACTEAPEELPQQKALQTEHEEIQREENEDHLARVVVLMLNGQPAQQQHEAQQAHRPELAQLHPEPDMPERPIHPRKHQH